MTIDIYSSICEYDNLHLAYRKARKGKTLTPYVKEFSNNLKNNLLDLRNELVFNTYKPKPLETFIIRDPKTRKISKSDFRDRVIHHAIHNIIEPIFEDSFIYDSYANRKGKGVLKAVERFDLFKRKVSKNNTRQCYILKADIKSYFDTVNHEILLNLLKTQIKDERTMWLIKIILKNHKTLKENIGMPLGNLTSQFFANVYLNELDQFIKHKLKIKFYIRYVDDFVILNHQRVQLESIKIQINNYLKNKLNLTLHPEKSKIIQLKEGISFLGLRIFYYHKLLKKKNLRKFKRKLEELISAYEINLIDYDRIYNFLEGWIAYSKRYSTYKLRNNIIKKNKPLLEKGVSSKEVNLLIKST